MLITFVIPYISGHGICVRRRFLLGTVQTNPLCYQKGQIKKFHKLVASQRTVLGSKGLCYDSWPK